MVDEPIWKRTEVVAQSLAVAGSFRRWTGRDLVTGGESAFEVARRLFEAPFVVVAHGLEEDPVLSYGNAAALALWEMGWGEFTRTPSRLTAEAPERAERERLLAAVKARGFIDDYGGIRISRSGRRFRISGATVWEVVAGDGTKLGQAASFGHWDYLTDG